MTTETKPDSMIAWLPDLVYLHDSFAANQALVCDADGTIVKIVSASELRHEKKINLPRRALLPGLINAHSHAFQRVIRGRTEYRSHPSSFRGGLPPARSGISPTLFHAK